MPGIVKINLKKLRRELWGKSADVAQMLGITPQSLSRKLGGHHKLTLDELNQIALHLGRNTSDFLIVRSVSGRGGGVNYSEEVTMEAKNTGIGNTVPPEFKVLLQNENKDVRLQAIEVLEILLEGANEKIRTKAATKVAAALEELDERYHRQRDCQRQTDHELRQERLARRKRSRVDDLIRLAERNVTPEWLTAVRDAGFSNLSIDEVITLAEHDVNAEWLQGLYDAGLTDLSVDEIIQLAEHDVDIEWLKGMHGLGLIGESEPSEESELSLKIGLKRFAKDESEPSEESEPDHSEREPDHTQ